MIDRIFATLLLLVTLAYGLIAFTLIKAPFQYDPLGPESWPRLLSVVATLCILGLLWKPDVERFDIKHKTGFNLAVVTLMLVAYAGLYQPLGFVLSTLLFATLMSRLLGAGWSAALIFGFAAGVLGYGLCAGLLGLNLPAGPLPRI